MYAGTVETRVYLPFMQTPYELGDKVIPQWRKEFYSKHAEIVVRVDLHGEVGCIWPLTGLHAQPPPPEWGPPARSFTGHSLFSGPGPGGTSSFNASTLPFPRTEPRPQLSHLTDLSLLVTTTARPRAPGWAPPCPCGPGLRLRQERGCWMP